MKVRDLKTYRQLIYNGAENENTAIGSADGLLRALDGLNARLPPRIDYIQRLVQTPEEQIFYELLQNAHDAHSDRFHAQFDDEGILFINTGDVFTTEQPEMNENEELFPTD